VVAVSTTGWWTIGFVVGGLVVVVAAAMLLILIALARRITRQAHDVEAALRGAHRNTESLFDIAMMNHALESITRGVRRARHEQEPEESPAWLARLAAKILPGGLS